MVIIVQFKIETAFLLVLWGIAFAMAGIVVGFLFGIPRDDSSIVNNNLVEISDWLTKIIVGLGLTELRALPEHVGRITRFMASGGGATFGQSAAGATMIYFSAVGFLHGYLLTRLVLNLRFAKTTRELGAILGKSERKALAEASLSTETEAEDEKQAHADPQLRAVASVSLDELALPANLVTWAKANLKLGNSVLAVDGYTKAAAQLPNDARVTAELGMAMFKAGRPPTDAYSQLLRAKDMLSQASNPKLRRDIYRWLTYVSLYRDKPASFEDAIRLAQEYLTFTDAEPTSGLLINKACAHGQEFVSERTTNSSSVRLVPIQNNALKALQRAVTIRPSVRVHIGRLLHGEIVGDDDLVVFSGNPGFEALVTSGVDASEEEAG